MSQAPMQDFLAAQLSASAYDDSIGPFYLRRSSDNELSLGLWLEPRHCNPNGVCHGAMIVSTADLALRLAASADQSRFRCVSLSCDYLAPAPAGTWLQSDVELLRRGSRFAFCSAALSVDGKLVANVTAVLSSQ